MPTTHSSPEGPSVELHLLGEVDFASCLALQHRLVYETSGHRDGQCTVLICEHPLGITLGRLGSRAHVQLPPRELESHRLTVDWVNRGGGAVLHTPGQLAVYPIVPLEKLGLTVGDYLERLHQALLDVLSDVSIAGQNKPQRHGIWGRSGQLVAIGAAVRDWVTYHGAFINVDPSMRLFRGVQHDPWDQTPMSSLAAERKQPVKMAAVRASLPARLTAALGISRYHIHTGHPLLARRSRTPHESARR